jgi:hypothetical protein
MVRSSHPIEGFKSPKTLNSQPGELTDRGRETTFALGQRLRHLYVDQLGYVGRTFNICWALLTFKDAKVDIGQ